MTLQNVWRATCDQCGTEWTGRPRGCRPTRRRALARLAALGWDLGRGDIADLCPECASLNEFSEVG